MHFLFQNKNKLFNHRLFFFCAFGFRNILREIQRNVLMNTRHLWHVLKYLWLKFSLNGSLSIWTRNLASVFWFSIFPPSKTHLKERHYFHPSSLNFPFSYYLHLTIPLLINIVLDSNEYQGIVLYISIWYKQLYDPGSTIINVSTHITPWSEHHFAIPNAKWIVISTR